MRIDVIGGGPAGLIAARRAAQLGAKVRLVDRGEFGGMIQPARLISGCTVDIGAEAFATRGGAVRTLIDELGLGDDVVAPRPLGSWGYANGRAYLMPPGGFMGIPRDADAVAHVLSEHGVDTVRTEAQLDPSAGADATTLAELVRARFGDEVLERLVAPVSRGAYSIDPHDVDVNAVLPGITAQIHEHGSLSAALSARRARATPGALVNTVRGGMHRVVAALVRECERLGVELHPHREVTQLPSAGDADAVIVTVAPNPRFPWLHEIAPAANTDEICAAQHAASDTVATEVVALAVAADDLAARPRGTGVLVAASNEPGTGGHTVRAKALTHASAKWEWLDEAAGDLEILRLSYGPARDEAAGAPPLTASLSDAELKRLARADAAELLGIAPQQLRVIRHARQLWRMPAPSIGVGRPALLDTVRAAIASQGPAMRVHACGTWLDGTGLATVVPGAIAAADAAVRGAPALGH